MPSLTNLLRQSPSNNEVVVGVIVSRGIENKYRIKVGRNEYIAESLLTEVLPGNTKVIVAQIGGEVFITSREKIRDQQLLEVTING